jgi:hypothetical protein
MTGQLQHFDGGGTVRCGHCGAEAIGPCARCRKPICADCGVLTEGSAHNWVICLGCDRRGGNSLLGPWIGLAVWLLVPIGLLALLVGLLYAL